MFDTLTRKYRDLQNRREDGEGGFTLIELLVVVVIIGILIAIAIPLYLNYTNGAKQKSVQADIRSAVAAVQQCFTDNDNSLPVAADSSDTTNKLTLTCSSDGNTTEDSPVTKGNSLSYSGPDSTKINYTITGTDKNGNKYEYFTSGANEGQIVPVS